MSNDTRDNSEDLQAVGISLEIARSHGLETEVVYTALKAMKEDTTLTIAQAITIGENEWVK